MVYGIVADGGHKTLYEGSRSEKKNILEPRKEGLICVPLKNHECESDLKYIIQIYQYNFINTICENRIKIVH